MIVCPNCNHQNPDSAVQCEACYTPLPVTTKCPNCGTTVQADATFCGQCGFNLKSTVAPDIAPDIAPEVPPLVMPDPLVVSNLEGVNLSAAPSPDLSPLPPTPIANIPEPISIPEPIPEPISIPEAESGSPPPPLSLVGALGNNQGTVAPTRLQQQRALLIHVQTDKEIELPQNLSIIHLGKPNDKIPPDIDLAGFPNSEVVSRIHADIRAEGDAYYIEDVGSSNGTYINNMPLPQGNRHRLRPGDRVSLGKGDLVTFLFQLS